MSGIPTENSGGRPTAPKWVRGRNNLADTMNCLYAEFDNKDLPKTGVVDWYEDHITKMNPHPSIVVHSGGGYHCYWLLTETFYITDDNRKAVRDLIKAWVSWAGADNVKDIARVLRIPFTYNGKYDPAPRVALKYVDYSQEYFISDLASLVRDRVETRPKPGHNLNIYRDGGELDEMTELKFNALK